MNHILDEWFDYGIGPEGSFTPEFFNRTSRYGDLNNDRLLRRLVEDISRTEMLQIMRSRWKKGCRLDITPDMIAAEIQERNYAGVVYAVLRCVADTQNRSRIGNNLPGYWRHLEMLHSLFGDLVGYLCVLRVSRDFALSTMKTPSARNRFTPGPKVGMRRFRQKMTLPIDIPR